MKRQERDHHRKRSPTDNYAIGPIKQIGVINYKPTIKAPTIRTDVKDFGKGIRFMIDTGAEINIIKRGAIKSKIEIDKGDVIKVCGIIDNHI